MAFLKVYIWTEINTTPPAWIQTVRFKVMGILPGRLANTPQSDKLRASRPAMHREVRIRKLNKAISPLWPLWKAESDTTNVTQQILKKEKIQNNAEENIQWGDFNWKTKQNKTDA